MTTFGLSPRKPGTAPGQQRATPSASTPSRFRSSLVPMTRSSPRRNLLASGKSSRPTGNDRDIFTTTASPKPSRVAKFAPTLPAAATKPLPGIRKFAKSTTAGMADTASSELFKMRIPSPDPRLTGEALAQELPQDLDTGKTIYADQYLSHKCPPEFDALQRRQFFCILDLRRLKFAANEIFAKKDWKLNILNFAKEFEKGRGRIMLHYGLYEFKNVKPSAEVLKRWRAAHNLPEPEPETASKTNGTPGPKTSTKRKAEEDLPSKSDVLATSSGTSQNKRRNVEPTPVDSFAKFAPSAQGKRKADDADDAGENEHSKLPKQADKATPSTARSKLASMIDEAQSGSSTPAGSPVKRTLFNTGTASPAPAPLFGAIKKPSDSNTTSVLGKSNPFAPSTNGGTGAVSKSSSFESTKVSENTSSGSVLSTHKIGSAATTETPSNMFSHLSESSANNSGNENDDDDESPSEHDTEPEAESQDTAPSQQPSATTSTGTTTPLPQAAFSEEPETSSDSFEAPQPAAKPPTGGLFGRVTMGPDGQPLRALSPVEKEPKTPSPSTELKPTSQTTAKKPGDYTFDPSKSAISFTKPTNSSTPVFGSQPASSTPVFGSKPASSTPVFGSKPAHEEAASASQPISEPKPAASEPIAAPPKPSQPLFGGLNKASEADKPSIFAPKPASQPPTASQQPSTPMFGTPHKAPEASNADATPRPSFAFGAPSFGPPKSTPTASPAFGAPSVKPAESEPSAAKEQPKAVFGTPSVKMPGSTNGSAAPPVFGGSSTPSGEARPVFGAPKTSKRGLDDDQEEQTPKRPMFGTPSHNSGPPAKSPMFGASGFGTQTADRRLFGFSKPDNESDGQSKSTFGASNAFGTPKPPSEKPLFGANAFGTSNTFGTSNAFGTPKPNGDTPLFGGPKPTDASNQPPKTPAFGTPTTNLFGTPKPNNDKPLFGAPKPADEAQNQAPKTPMFGAPKKDTATENEAPKTPIFGAIKKDTATENEAPKTPIFGALKKDTATENGKVGGDSNQNDKPIFGAASSMFGASNTKAAAPPTMFGGKSTSFGSPAPAKPEPSAPKPNMFGGIAPTNSGSFTFGAQNNAQVPSFGGSGSTTPNFNFTGAPAAGGSTTPFSFGAGQTDSQNSSESGSFTFQAGGSQPVSNPFTFGASSQAPASAPSPTTTPSGSFGFQFGGGPSTPQPAQQPDAPAPKPSFSFTSATPLQNTPNASAPKPAGLFGNLLQPGAGNSTGANSPFPASSSINSTPANGTPEPESQADGDAEDNHPQVTLTQGGPGEENETILHEIRAKATVYSTIPAGGAADETPPKTPWVVKGVGPLRMLKSRTTGFVRILLRSEPRGQIAMNKTILSDFSYKADGKKIRVIAAADDGSGLETWIVQVKRPEEAVELARLMEEHKAANKK